MYNEHDFITFRHEITHAIKINHPIVIIYYDCVTIEWLIEEKVKRLHVDFFHQLQYSQINKLCNTWKIIAASFSHILYYERYFSVSHLFSVYYLLSSSVQGWWDP